MDTTTAYIVGIGLVSPAGVGVEPLIDVIRKGERRIGQLTAFPGPDGIDTLPVAEIDGLAVDDSMPRTHTLALAAAEEAMREAGLPRAPDAVVLGGTTGGIPTTELLIGRGVDDAEAYRWHGAGTVAEHVARSIGCSGPALTVATACSSGAVAIKIALEMLRRGEARTVLAGGVDALCRLTYHGFNMLKLIDPEGAKPLDAERAGMTVGEGAAMLVLVAADEPPPKALAAIRGGGLSCDAYHASSPHPEGIGALAAMRAALDDAGVTPGDIDYVVLHGTGTVDNDASEAKGLHGLFGEGATLPRHSSIKGAFGHAVGAAGAFGAAIAALAISRGVVPANVGCERPDPKLALSPVLAPVEGVEVETVLSNALGFGGNNAALVVTGPRRRESERAGRVEGRTGPETATSKLRSRLRVLGASCVTGAGLSAASLEALGRGGSLAGTMDAAQLVQLLPKGRIRRVKRLTRLAMAMTAELGQGGEPPVDVSSIFLGTCWGTLSETHDFLVRLFDSGERFSSPTDFVGTVHNSVAGQLAMWLGAQGPNVTATTGETSFEDALYLSTLLAQRGEGSGKTLVLGLDEAHPVLTPRLDPEEGTEALADGGGALLLGGAGVLGDGPTLWPAFRGRASERVVDELIEALGGVERIADEVGEIWVSVPGVAREPGDYQFEIIREKLDGKVPRRDLRQLVGAYPTSVAAATALAVLSVVDKGQAAKGVLVVSLGHKVSAIEVQPG